MALSNEFRYLCELVGASALGRVPALSGQQISMEQVLQLAEEQTVYEIAACALKKAPEAFSDQTVYDNMVKRLRGNLIREVCRREAVLSIIGEMERQGIRTMLFKGMVLSMLYSVPESRTSADVDLYVDPKDEQAALQILRDHGCRLEKRESWSKHTVCQHPVAGTIELHIALFCDVHSKQWFGAEESYDGISEAFEQVELPDQQHVLTMGENDNAMFVTLHMVKHFINCGTHLRNVMDVGLLLKKYLMPENAQGFWNALARLQYQGVVNTALSACVYYGGMEQEDFEGMELADRSIVDLFLEDLETGGWMGWKDYSDRRESRMAYIIYTDKKYHNGGASAENGKGRISKMLRMVFCPAEQLRKTYPYSRKHALLLPIAWMHNLFGNVMPKVYRYFAVQMPHMHRSIPAASQRRIKLFKEMGIME